MNTAIDVSSLKRFLKQHIWGPVGSVVFHVFAVVMVLIYATTSREELMPPDVPPVKMEIKPAPLDPAPVLPPEVPKPIDLIPLEAPQPERPPDLPPGTYDGPPETPEGTGIGDTGDKGIGSDADSPLLPGFEVAPNNSPLRMPGLFGGRTPKGIGEGITGNGGTTPGEEAVLRALRWLKANQGADGSWAKAENQSPPALAGLALLCFLAHGETPKSVEFGETVEKAMRYIVSQQGADGSWMGSNGQQGSYQHGICTYAVSEGFGMTKIMALKDAMDKGVQFMLDGQQACGGYDYGFKKEARWDLSVAGWQFQAMKAAKLVGCSNEKLDEGIRKATTFLRTQAFDPAKNIFQYSPGSAGPAGGPSMTAAGVLALQLLGKPEVSEVRNGLKYLANLDCQWSKDAKGKNAVYTWYYVTQAKFQQYGNEWKNWNAKFQAALVPNQIKEGKLGHWEGGDHGGSVYTTTLCCLMLEVYYRYSPLKTYSHVAAAPEVSPPKTEDVVVMLQ